MSATTSIEWTDATWNPVTGCTKVSKGCDNCYIERTPPFRMSGRKFDKPGIGGTTGVKLHPDRLDQPLKWAKPRMVFVNSLSDLFHRDVPTDYIVDVFLRMWWAPQHTFQVLTKRPDIMRSKMPHIEAALRRVERDLVLTDAPTPLTWPLPNVWLGVSVEDQQRADLRIPALLKTPAAKRFLSCEPLLGPVDLTLVDFDGATGLHVLEGSSWCVDWVIVGGESGHGARPMHPDWVRTLRDQCAPAGVPFFFKQWGEWTPSGWGIGIAQHNVGREVLIGPPADDMGHRQVMRRVGKKQAGRELDGRTHNEFPKEATSA